MRRLSRKGSRRFRRLFHEQFEDRRLLATANDDSYTVDTGGTLTVPDDGTWSNDTYHSSWDNSHWVPTWVPDQFDGDGNLIEPGYWDYDNLQWVEETDHAWSSINSGPQHGTLQQVDTGDNYTDYDDNGNEIGSGQYGYAFTYTPHSNFTGVDSFTYTLYDDSGSSTATVWIGVSNSAPSVTDDSYTIGKGSTLTGSALDNDSDPDGDSLTASLVTQPASGTLSFSSDGSFTYTPNDVTYVGTDSFTYSATDGMQSTQGTVTIDITDSPPSFANTSFSTHHGVPVAGNVGASDPDNDALTLSLITGTSNGNLLFNTSDGSFTYTPNSTFHGTDSFVCEVDDGSLLTDATVTIDVTNIAPNVASASYTIDRGTSLSDNVVASDADGDPLTLTVVSGVAHGSVSLNSDATFIYTPTSDFAGIDSFIYRADDGAETSDATIAITVNGAPAASDLSAATDQEISIGLTLSANDPNSDALTYTILSGPTHGSLSGSAPGLIYTPAPDYYGIDSFSYLANDGLLNSNTATVSLTINPPPTADDGSVSTLHDDSVDVDLSASGGTGGLAYTILTSPAHGSLTGIAPHMHYAPAPNSYGDETITFRVTDTMTTSNTATLVLSVVDHPPVAVDDSSYTVDENQVLTVPGPSILANDTDQDPGDKANLKAVLASSPSHGSLSLDPSGFFVYRPGSNFSGTDTFTYRANDGILSSINPATVTITVSPFTPYLSVPAATHPLTVNAAQTSPATATPINLLATVVNGDVSAPPSSGTWLQLSNGVPHDVHGRGPTGTMLLLTNGDIMVQKYGDTATSGAVLPSSAWYKLSPSAAGNYLDGTWTSSPSMPSMTVPRLYYGSNVLPDGRVLIVGGEYSGSESSQAELSSAEIYDPLAPASSAWSQAAPFPNSDFHFGDKATALLPSGQVLSDGEDRRSFLYTANAGAGLWSRTGLRAYYPDDGSGRNGYDGAAEESWVLLSDGSVLTYDLNYDGGVGLNDPGVAERYVPSLGRWLPAGTIQYRLGLKVTETDGSSFFEIGPALRLADGRVLFIGAAPAVDASGNPSGANTAIYTPPAANDPTGTGSWVRGPNVPDGYGSDDAPAAELPNGHIIFAADKPTDHASGTRLFDFDPAGNGGLGSISQITTLPAQLQSDLAFAAFDTRLLVLPTGQVLFSTGSTGHLWVFTPPGSPGTPSRPTISNVVSNGTDSRNNLPQYTLTGTQLTGISEGAAYGDDAEMSTNYPIVQLTDEHGQVFYARTFGWTPGVGTGDTQVTTNFDKPAGVDLANHQYTLVVIANGIASKPIDFNASLGLTYVLNSGPSHAAPNGFSLNSNGTANYTPDATFHNVDSFTYKVSGFQDVATVTINVDSPPVAVVDSYTTPQGNRLTEDTNHGLLANDMDPDTSHANLKAVILTSPARGELYLNLDGSFAYTPDRDYVADTTLQDTFSYEVSDGQLASSVMQVTINLTPHQLHLNDDDYVVAAGDELALAGVRDARTEVIGGLGDGTIRAFGFLLNDDIYDSEKAWFRVVDGQGPQHGSALQFPQFAVRLSGIPGFFYDTFYYVPAANFPGGVDTFKYEAAEDIGNPTLSNNQATVTVHVAAKPTANSDNYSVIEDSSAQGTTLGSLLANDSDLGLPASYPLEVFEITGQDANGNPVTATVSASHSGSVPTGHGTVTVNFDGTFSYTPDPNYPNYNGQETFSYRIDNLWAHYGPLDYTDHNGNSMGLEVTLPNGEIVEDVGDIANHQSTPATVVINVTPVNDPPAGHDNTTVVHENLTYTFSAADFGFTDPNDQKPPSTNPTDPNSLFAVRITTLPATGTLLDHGAAVTAGQDVSVADIVGGMLRFTPATNGAGNPYTSFTFQVQDDGGTANGGVDLDPSPNTLTIDVTVNHAPLGHDKTVATNEDTAYIFDASDFGFSDPNDSPPDILLAVEITTVPSVGTLTLFNGTSDVPVTSRQFIQVTDIDLNRLKFRPAANASGSPYTTFTFQLQDSGGTGGGGADLDQTARTMTLNVISVNDPPIGANKTINPLLDNTLLEDHSYAFSVADFGFSDSNDNPPNALTAVKITALPTAGMLTLGGAAVAAGNLVSSSAIASGSLLFLPAANGNGAPYATFTFQVKDNGGTANGGVDLDPNARTMTINVTSVNDAPAGANNTINPLLDNTLLEDHAYTFATADFGFSDSNDNPSNALTAVKISSLPSSGTLSLNGAAVAPGDFVAVNSIASGLLVFAPAHNGNGLLYTTFTFQVKDNGGTANGGVDLDPTARTMTIDVTQVNDAPVGANAIMATLEDLSYTFTVNDFNFSDPSDAPAFGFLAVKVATLPNHGSLTFNGSAVTAGQLVLASDIAAGKLRFLGATNGNGSPYTTFTFQVKDDGGTANGGSDLDPTARTITINVTSVPDAPTGSNNTIPADPWNLLENLNYRFTTDDFGFSDPYDNPPNNLLAVQIVTLPGQGTLRVDGAPALHALDFVSVSDIIARKLNFIPAVNTFGTPYTSFTFKVKDDGGTTNGGSDLDPNAKTMTINVTFVNHQPTFTQGSNQNVSDEDGVQTVPGWATQLSKGPPSESSQSFLGFNVTTDHDDWFVIKPTVTVDTQTNAGTLTYWAPNAHGTVHVYVSLQDDGGTDYLGQDTSFTHTFTITITKPHPRQNAENPYDVSGDGLITEHDASLIKERLDSSVDSTDFGPPYYDVSGDNYVSPVDILDIINYINSFAGPYGVGGYVYVDSNGNGKHDTGEAGIANVPIQLIGVDSNGDSLVLNTTTSSDGTFMFDSSGTSPSSGQPYDLRNTSVTILIANESDAALNGYQPGFDTPDDFPLKDADGNTIEDHFAYMDPSAVDQCIVSDFGVIDSDGTYDEGWLVSFGRNPS